jgi:uncharacterized membrane protein YagU involved in acid resistance
MFPLIVVAAGITGTVLMTGIMWFIHRAGWANADMTRAVGSLVTRRYEKSLVPGIVLHFGAGCVFAIPYLLIVRTLGNITFLEHVLVCAAIGVFHGAAMIFVLMAIAESHPVERFRTAGVEVAGAHVVGHIAYGIGVGIVAGLAAGGGSAVTAAVASVLGAG